MERKQLTSEAIMTMAEVARLNLPKERFQLQADTLNEIFQMLDIIGNLHLGETVPAFVYKAKWEDKS